MRVYECLHRARQEAWRGTESGTARALEHVQKGLEVIGESEALYGAMGLLHFEAVNVNVIAKVPDETDLREVERCAEKAFALNPNSPHGHYLRGSIVYKRGDLQRSLTSFRTAYELDPEGKYCGNNSLQVLFYLSAIYMLTGRTAIALPYARRFMEVDPLNGLSQCWWSWVETHGGKLDASLERGAATRCNSGRRCDSASSPTN